MRRRSSGARTEGQRWHVPPPAWSVSGIEGACILDAYPSELGTVLWQALRTVTRWTRARPAKRAEMFLPGAYKQRVQDLQAAAVPPELEQPLGTIAALLKNVGADPAAIAEACARIAVWMDAGGSLEAAVEFVHAAALACPSDPS